MPRMVKIFLTYMTIVLILGPTKSESLPNFASIFEFEAKDEMMQSTALRTKKTDILKPIFPEAPEKSLNSNR